MHPCVDRTSVYSLKMVQIMEVEFDDQFGGKEYSRNNRSSGQKSLRCFPHCCEGKHRPYGFCGAPVYATAILRKTHIPLADISIVGQIRPEHEPMLSIETGPIREQDIQNQIRSEENKRAELLPGSWAIRNETEDSYEVQIVLNASLRSYDYCWKSNRWASGITTHVVDIILLSKDAGDIMTVISSAHSQPFVVVSTKKAVTGSHGTSSPAVTIKPKPKLKVTKAVRKCDAVGAASGTGVPSSSGSSGSENASCRIRQADLAELALVRPASFIFDVQYHQELADQGEQLRNLRRMAGGWTKDPTPSAMGTFTHDFDGWSPHASIGQNLVVLPQFCKGC